MLQWLAQKHGGKPMAHGIPKCLRAVAAVAEMVRMAEKIVLSYPLGL